MLAVMHFTTIVLKNIVRARSRSLLTIAGAGVAIGSLVALSGIAKGLIDSTRDVYEARGVDLVVIRAGAYQGLTSTLPESLGPRIMELPGVVGANPALVDMIRFEKKGLDAVMLMGWTFNAPPLHDVKLLAGRRLQPGDTSCAFLGQKAAANLGVGVGDTIELYDTEPFEVVGIFESYSVFENGGIIIPLAELQRLMAHEGEVTGIGVNVREPMDDAQLDALRGKIEALAPGVLAQTPGEFALTNSWIKVARGMAWVTSLVALAIGAAGMLNTMLTSVLERTREIGVLRAIGWRKRRIGMMIVLESLVLSLVGAAVGSAAAVALVRLLVHVPMLSGYFEGHIGWPTFASGVSVAVAFAILGGAYPAWLGMRVLPANALRS